MRRGKEREGVRTKETLCNLEAWNDGLALHGRVDAATHKIGSSGAHNLLELLAALLDDVDLHVCVVLDERPEKVCHAILDAGLRIGAALTLRADGRAARGNLGKKLHERRAKLGARKLLNLVEQQIDLSRQEVADGCGHGLAQRSANHLLLAHALPDELELFVGDALMAREERQDLVELFEEILVWILK